MPQLQPSLSLIDDLPSQPLISFSEFTTPLPEDARSNGTQISHPPLMTPSATIPTLASSQSATGFPSNLLNELLYHEDDPMYFSRSASTSRLPTPKPPSAAETPDAARPSRHLTREESRTEPVDVHRHSPPMRSPSIPPTPMRLSDPEVQRTQSFFAPSSFSAPSFPTKWVSSLLSRPVFSVHPPLSSEPSTEIDGLPAHSHSRAATMPGATPITHGTPFAAHPYVPPSGAPGFAGDRSWNKGFEFDKENVERASVKLVGRKEGTHGILSVAMANQVCSSPRRTRAS